ncbi:MAG TPA: hypothetical protein VM070_07620 [Candidatus Saccharimonadales bacterium]|nr:hypothetical protein [Candidatus Saccharimonadales bacterium]
MRTAGGSFGRPGRSGGSSSSHFTRTLVAAFDAAAMSVFAYVNTGGSFGRLDTDVLLWGSAVAASFAAFVVATNGPGLLAWTAIGYILFAAVFVTERPELILVALAVALMPVAPRPRGSLGLGLIVALVAAFAWRFVVAALVRGA